MISASLSSLGNRQDSSQSTTERLEHLVAGAVVVLLGARIYVAYELSIGVLLGLALLPIWWLRVREFAGAPLLLTAISAAIVVGVWLSDFSASDHDVLGRQRILNLTLILSLAVGLGLVLWARTLLSEWLVATLFGVGMLGAIRVNEGVLESPWKFGFDKPVSLIVLAAACASRNRFVAPSALVVLAAVGATSGARSRSAILLVTLVVVLWQSLPAPKSARASMGRVVAAVAALGYAVYQFGQAMLLEGALGEAAQQRTQEQIAQSGSLIVGGRPEMAAAWALMRDRFEGFGFGVAVNQHGLDVAKAGMLDIGYDPDNGYVSNFMFGSGIELHSGIGDLWAYMGPAGFILALSLLGMIGWRLTRLVAKRRASAVVLMLGLTVVWDLAFSPLKTSLPFLVIGVALVLRRVDSEVGAEEDLAERQSNRAS